jgi:hypothetical protein
LPDEFVNRTGNIRTGLVVTEDHEGLKEVSFLLLVALVAWLCTPVFSHVCLFMKHLDDQLLEIAPDHLRTPYSVMHYIYYYLFAFPARGYTTIWKCAGFIGTTRPLMSIAGTIAVLLTVFYTSVLIAIYTEIQNKLSARIGMVSALAIWVAPLGLYLGYVFFVRAFLDHDPFPTKLSGLPWLPTNTY